MSKSNVPDSWGSCKLGDVVEFLDRLRRPISSEKRKDGPYPYYGANGLQGFHNEFIFDEKLLLLAEDGGHFGSNTKDIAYTIEGKTWVNNHAHVLRPIDGVEIDFLLHYLRRFDVRPWVTGATVPKLNQEKSKSLPVVIPPHLEQKRIVEKIEATQEKIRTIEESVSKAEELIVKYRESLLQKAFRGQLVPQDPNDEPASELLKRIRAERAQATDSKKKKKEDLPPISDDEIPFKIPSSWTWVRLNEIVSTLGDGLHGTPTYDQNGEYFFINGNNLADGTIEIKDGTKRISKSEFEKHKKPLNDRSMLVSINGTIGKVAFYRGENVILGKSACYFNLLEDINKGYLKSLIASNYFLNYANSAATGSTIKNVSLQTMRNFLIPLPPTNEQSRINSAIDSMSATVGQMQKIVDQCNSSSKSLFNSILESAFSGSLVMQDSTEGTGHDLLRKITNSADTELMTGTKLSHSRDKPKRISRK